MTDKKHRKHDEKRKYHPRLPSSRITNEDKAQTMEKLYSLSLRDTKLDLIVDSASFALTNEKLFLEYREALKNKQKNT